MRLRAYHFGLVPYNSPTRNPKPFGEIIPDGLTSMSYRWPWPYYSDGSQSVGYTEAIDRWGLSKLDSNQPRRKKMVHVANYSTMLHDNYRKRKSVV